MNHGTEKEIKPVSLSLRLGQCYGNVSYFQFQANPNSHFTTSGPFFLNLRELVRSSTWKFSSMILRFSTLSFWQASITAAKAAKNVVCRAKGRLLTHYPPSAVFTRLTRETSADWPSERANFQSIAQDSVFYAFTRKNGQETDSVISCCQSSLLNTRARVLMLDICTIFREQYRIAINVVIYVPSNTFICKQIFRQFILKNILQFVLFCFSGVFYMIFLSA